MSCIRERPILILQGAAVAGMLWLAGPTQQHDGAKMMLGAILVAPVPIMAIKALLRMAAPRI